MRIWAASQWLSDAGKGCSVGQVTSSMPTVLAGRPKHMLHPVSPDEGVLCPCPHPGVVTSSMDHGPLFVRASACVRVGWRFSIFNHLSIWGSGQLPNNSRTYGRDQRKPQDIGGGWTGMNLSFCNGRGQSRKLVSAFHRNSDTAWDSWTGCPDAESDDGTFDVNAMHRCPHNTDPRFPSADEGLKVCGDPSAGHRIVRRMSSCSDMFC